MSDGKELLSAAAAIELLALVPEHAQEDVKLAGAAFREGASYVVIAFDYVVAAIEKGATQQQIADALGMSQPWLSQKLKWHKNGCPGTPFGPQSLAKRQKQKAEYQAPNSARPDVAAGSSSSGLSTGATAPSSAAGLEVIQKQEIMLLTGPSGEAVCTEAPPLSNDCGVPLEPTTTEGSELGVPAQAVSNGFGSSSPLQGDGDGLDIPPALIRLLPEDQRRAEQLLGLWEMLSQSVRWWLLARMLPRCPEVDQFLAWLQRR